MPQPELSKKEKDQFDENTEGDPLDGKCGSVGILGHYKFILFMAFCTFPPQVGLVEFPDYHKNKHGRNFWFMYGWRYPWVLGFWATGMIMDLIRGAYRRFFTWPLACFVLVYAHVSYRALNVRMNEDYIGGSMHAWEILERHLGSEEQSCSSNDSSNSMYVHGLFFVGFATCIW